MTCLTLYEEPKARRSITLQCRVLLPSIQPATTWKSATVLTREYMRTECDKLEHYAPMTDLTSVLQGITSNVTSVRDRAVRVVVGELYMRVDVYLRRT
jgi:hypothetical protein